MEKEVIRKKSKINKNMNARIKDLDGIKRALRFYIEREQRRDISSSHCGHVNSHDYNKEEEIKDKESIIKFYKPIIEGLK